jgi:DNA-binding transcriptional MerR regulator
LIARVVALGGGANVAGAAAERSLIEAGRLARVLVVPATILSYFEARLPEVRALKENGQRFYRAEDAILLAGVATLLYRDGMTFRDVATLLATEREKVAAMGRERLAGEVSLAPRPSARPIPDDAVVRARSDHVRAGPPPGRASADALLADLLECIRLLEAARAA